MDTFEVREKRLGLMAQYVFHTLAETSAEFHGRILCTSLQWDGYL